ncbi:TrkH family potassium uptake protein [Halalkalibacter alkaliphilus]|jgi:potassium uptake TrkH family protein|uniref:TrkH family potassium uptake protein n=1 Tax=Halalkalibacter alkaliphilus TaxID=2917993 RepID=A0A9X2CTM5_9BACI|nr:TrkH family potassium uptake protein [Halalkalibacter alkaliphilus]MCL7748050.1 TrkH family potassium uptake protein [Halalkalibacter alkaliphilus]
MKSGLNQFLSPFRIIIISYIVAMVIFSLLLYLPISHQPGVTLTYSEALFTSVSAVSVTGLTVVNVSETYSYIGIIFLAMAIQLGGIGIMTMGTFVWMLFGRKINFAQRMLIMVDQNQINFSGLVNLMRGILIVALIIEAIGALILGTYYIRYFDTIGQAYYQGAFASLSAFTNAGFDVTGESLIPFANDYYVQFVTILLIFGGAIGFPVLLEIKEYFSRKDENFKFSLFTKITTTTYFAVFVLGVIGIWALESGHYYVGLEWHQQLFYSVFNSATSRSGGLATMDISELNPATLLFISGLMIIGASPSSVGGGIRTTTIAVMFLTIRSFALGKEDVKVFGREIHPEDKQKAFIVLSVFLVLLFAAVTLITAFESRNPNVTLLAIIFETASAFGTCGLSMGITPDLSIASQSVLIILMFIGRVGLIAFLFSVRKRETKTHFKYPTERIIIG